MTGRTSHVATCGRIAQARPPPGPARLRMVWLLLAQLLERIVSKFLKLDRRLYPPPTVPDHKLEPGRDFLSAAIQPRTGPSRGTGRTSDARYLPEPSAPAHLVL